MARQQIDAALAQFPAFDSQVREDVAEWLIETVHYNIFGDYPLRLGTLESIFTAHFRAKVHSQLYAAGRNVGGWYILLIEPNRAEREKTGQPEIPTRQQCERDKAISRRYGDRAEQHVNS